MIGKIIEHYKIVEKIGEGGMGVVYKAHDTKLDRFVALKFLPQHLTTTETERARFLQEAKAAAALNHPNVCVIHEIQDSSTEHFIVMELIDGETIQATISKSAPIETERVLKYAIQIGEALEAAHKQGIVHRDIKSENIMRNVNDQIKVMDFGLAKLKGSLKLTKSSSTIGTLAYMAPEQAQGNPVDERADIFSFAVVLYEMLTGELPFKGEYEAALMFAILNEEPEPLQKHLPDASSGLLHIINRGLEKQPEERYQTVSDMLIDLRRAKKESGKVSRSSLQDMPVTQRSKSDRTKSLLRFGVAGAAIIGLMLAYMLLQPGRSTRLNPNMKFRILPTPYPDIAYPSLSRDGNWVAFPSRDSDGSWGVYFMNSAGGESRRIAYGTARISGVDISPDGSQVVISNWFQLNRATNIHIVSSLGGQSIQLADSAFAAEWRPDGNRIGFIRFWGYTESGQHELWSIRPDGSDSRIEFVDRKHAKGASGRSAFSWSPDGKSIAWVRSFVGPSTEIIIVDLATGEERQLTHDRKMIDEVAWTTSNDIIFSSTRGGYTNLWMMPVGGGEMVQVTKGSGPDIGMSVSSDLKRLLYLQREQVSHIRIANNKGGNSKQITFDDQHLRQPRLAPGGKRIAYVGDHPDPLQTAAAANLWVMDRNGSNRRQITFENESVAQPAWSPDGEHLAYHLSGRTARSVYTIKADSRGRAEPKFIGEGSFPVWLDSKNLAFVRLEKRRAYRAGMSGGEPMPVYRDSTIAFPIAGNYLFFYDTRSASRGMYVVANANVGSDKLNVARRIGGVEGYFNVSPTENCLILYVQPGEIYRISLPDGKRERLGGVFTNTDIERFSLDFSSDGTEVVYATTRVSAKLVIIEDFVN